MATQSTVLFFKKSFIYLAVLGLSYDVWGLLSSCAAWAYLPYGTWDLRSLTRDGTCVPCIGRRILNHWTTREAPTPVFLPGEFHGQRSLADYSPWDLKESDVAEQLNNSNSSLEGHPQCGMCHRNAREGQSLYPRGFTFSQRNETGSVISCSFPVNYFMHHNNIDASQKCYFLQKCSAKITGQIRLPWWLRR